MEYDVYDEDGDGIRSPQKIDDPEIANVSLSSDSHSQPASFDLTTTADQPLWSDSNSWLTPFI